MTESIEVGSMGNGKGSNRFKAVTGISVSSAINNLSGFDIVENQITSNVKNKIKKKYGEEIVLSSDFKCISHKTSIKPRFTIGYCIGTVTINTGKGVWTIEFNGDEDKKTIVVTDFNGKKRSSDYDSFYMGLMS